MSDVIAKRRLKQFQQKYGEAMVKFATHAALPVVLNSELVHLLRLNFFYSDTSIGYITEAEFLLSPFCREIGEDLYEIEPAMRTVLLQRLYRQHPKHIKEIAALLWQYSKRYTPWRTREGLQNAQLLTALNFLEAQKATAWLQNMEAQLHSQQREWFVAMQERIKREQELQGISTFEFETVTVNEGGEIINRSRHQATQLVEHVNGVEIEMVWVPGGTFMMGSPETEKRRYNSETLHQVTVASFYFGKYPITQAQWHAVMGENPSYFKGEKRSVENVSWNDAIAFCKKLSELTGKDYRLPSEAEWEYACRAGTTTPFYFGETITTELANYNGNYTYAYEPKGVYRRETIEVGRFPPNAFGLYDLHGNVWEWTGSEYEKEYNGKEQVNLTSADTDKYQRVLRGGSWLDDSVYCRVASRNWGLSGFRSQDVGFRVVVAARHY